MSEFPLFCFLRHAEPSSEEGSLTAKGEAQAASLELPFFASTFSSPAARCVETATIINGDRPITIIPALYLLLNDLSSNLIKEICKQILESNSSSILIVSHGGVTNALAAALFPALAPLLLGRRLGHAEGFLIQGSVLTPIKPQL